MRTRILLPVLLALAAHGCASSPSDNGTPSQLLGGATAAPPNGTAGATAMQMMQAPPNTTAGTTGGSAGTTANDPLQNSGTAGTAAPPAGGAGGTGSIMNPVANDPRGGCPTLDSGFPDDHACIAAPAASEGMQIHIGPSDYNDPAQINKHIFHPGQESSECWSFHTPNNEQIYYQTFVLSGRAGTHHIINSMYMTDVTDGGFTVCKDPGTGTSPDLIANLPGASKAYMPRGNVAPENINIGRSIGAKAPSQADMHYFNFTDKDILREFWMNIYFAPKEQIKQEATQIRGMGGLSWSVLPIAPGTDMVYKYECPISADGRINALLGHYHAHGKHFTAHVRHADGARDKVFEMFDYLDPAQFQYDSITTNPMFSDAAAGAVSGPLPVKVGDVLEWECHIVNDSTVGLTYTNEVKTGEMCNLWGESLGPNINCVVF